MPARSPVAFCAALTLLGGCATLTTGSSQNVSIITEPPGAACIFSREGQIIGVVNPTPGTLMVTKGHGDIRVRCSKNGFIDSAGLVGAKFQAMTFGNILFGGVIGIVVDAASGATGEYEPQITITMVPAQFASAEERDAFFARLRKSFAAEAEEVRERIRKLCSGPDCERQLALADEEEKNGMARIESQRLQARIVGPAAPAARTAPAQITAPAEGESARGTPPPTVPEDAR